MSTTTVWPVTRRWAHPVRKGSPLELVPLAVVVLLLLVFIVVGGEVAEERAERERAVIVTGSAVALENGCAPLCAPDTFSVWDHPAEGLSVSGALSGAACRGVPARLSG